MIQDTVDQCPMPISVNQCRSKMYGIDNNVDQFQINIRNLIRHWSTLGIDPPCPNDCNKQNAVPTLSSRSLALLVHSDTLLIGLLPKQLPNDSLFAIGLQFSNGNCLHIISSHKNGSQALKSLRGLIILYRKKLLKTFNIYYFVQ